MLHFGSDLTPSQRLAAQARRDRIARIAAAAKPDKPLPPLPLKKQLPPEPPFGEWFKRQERLWFSIVEEIDPTTGKKKTGIEDIKRVVARYYQVSVHDIISGRRTANVIRPRQVAMYLAKTMTPLSLPQIGRRIGNKDHTTVLYGVRKITRLLASDPDLAADIENIMQALA